MATIVMRPGKHGVTWQARVRMRGRAVSATFNRKSEAIAWATLMEETIRAGEALPGEAPPGDRWLADAVGEYLPALRARCKPATMRMYEECAGRIGRAFGGATLRGLSPADVLRYRDARLAVVGPASVRHDLSFLRGVYKHARLAWGLDVRCPAEGVPAPAPPRGREPLLSLAEIERLLDWCCVSASPMLYSYVYIMLHTAMRPSEAAGLRWDQVRLGERVIVLTETKTGRGRRVPLARPVVELLARLPRQGERVLVPDDHNPRAKISDYFRAAFATACRHAGLAGITLYSLRHIAASWLIMRGVDIRTVADIMGHSNIGMTSRYTHLLDTHRIEAVDRLGLG